MGIIFLNGGIYTTVQDMGRNGYQKSGFHVCGAMDKRAYKIANMLLDNQENEAVLEFTMMGPKIQFTSDSVIAITGGNYSPMLNNEPVSMYQAVCVKKDDILEFKFASDGNWGYLAFAGGLDIPIEMGSRSTDVKCKLGGYHGRKLENGDYIEFLSNAADLSNFSDRKLDVPGFTSEVTEIRVVLGPQDDYFTRKGINTFLSSEYILTSQSDRMGYRLDGEYIEHNEKGADIVSDGIALGSVQVPSDGKPIIMLADRQTTGGYTKIATVISSDIPKLVQCKYGKKLKFRVVSVQEAQALYLIDRNEYDEMKQKIHKSCQKKTTQCGFIKKIASIFK